MFKINYRDKQHIIERTLKLVIVLSLVIAIAAFLFGGVNKITQAASSDDNGNRIDLISSDTSKSGRSNGSDHTTLIAINTTYVGNHDGSEGMVSHENCNASGWAVDAENVGSDVTVGIRSDGSLITQTLANTYRPDVNPEICLEGSCGFYVNLWGLVSPGIEHQITAQVQGGTIWTDLDNTPRSLTCLGYPEGVHDGSEGVVGFGSCDAFGWAFDPDNYDRDVMVRILSDGNSVATTTADIYRSDIDQTICPEGTCGFYANLWGLVSAGSEHQIEAQAYDQESDTWISLDDAPKSLTCMGYPEGVHDGSEGLVEPTSCLAFGWAFDPDDYERDVVVRILSDGDPVATTRADTHRSDINQTICPEGTCGFEVSLWKLFTAREEHQIIAQVYDQESDSWIDLDDAPKSLTCWGYELYLPVILGQH